MWIDRRRLFVGLGASLIVNVFLVGIIAGHALWQHTAVGKPGPPALIPPGRVKALPDDDRKAFNAAMAPHRAAIRAARKAHREAKATAATDIAAATFDKDKVAGDFKALRDASATVQETIQDALLDALSKLPEASRAALVARTEDAVPGK